MIRWNQTNVINIGSFVGLLLYKLHSVRDQSIGRSSEKAAIGLACTVGAGTVAVQ